MKLIDQLISKWLDEDLWDSPDATLSCVDDFQMRNGVVFPPDFRDYILRANGFRDRYEIDSNAFSFWKLTDLTSIGREFSNRIGDRIELTRYFMFADHSIGLPTYAIRLNESGGEVSPVATVYSDFGHLDVEDSFDSFTMFIRRYLEDPIELATTLPRDTVRRVSETD